jgi:hypothetical protein
VLESVTVIRPLNATRASILTVGLVVTLACSPAGRAAADPPHGHWVKVGDGEVLVCDLTYYPVSDACVQPFAFRRPRRRADRLPSVITAWTSNARASRHIETVIDPSGRVWRLFLAIDNKVLDPSRDPCLEVAGGRSYWGALCVPGTDLVSPPSLLRWVMGDRVMVGVAGDEVDGVRVISAGGASDSISLPFGRGFIYFCHSDCGCQIRAIVSLAHNRVVGVDDLRDPRTHRLYWCA